jgi:hypothetical protein
MAKQTTGLTADDNGLSESATEYIDLSTEFKGPEGISIDEG